MSEDEARRLENEEQGDEVEGHRHPKLGANEEPRTEGEENDFEAHRHSLKGRPGRTA
jgi:hypothetical protein